ncbi:MAG: DUF983 domain-containing protein [Kiloniellales bacterium]
MSKQSYHPRVSPVAAGLGSHCPRCGRGRLYSGFLTVAERCSECGLDLKKADSGDGPAVFMIFILGALVVPLALLVESLFEPPYWLHVVLWPPLILGSALALLRPMKGLLIALQFHHRASDSGTQDYD